MNAKVYIETTIPSYLVARPSRDPLVAAHQQLTREWWEVRRAAFELYVSELVLEECRAGDVIFAAKRGEALVGVRVLPLTTEILDLASALIMEGVIPGKAAGDAIHIAVATAYACEYLLTWNCRHIANAEIQRALLPVVGGRGWNLPIICTPEELMGS
ncbi:MAG: type II toxin-antitoxin system VapC family toxin [Candidatus Korobacteraceae bacterium]